MIKKTASVVKGKEQENIDTIHKHKTLSKMKKTIYTTGLIPSILFMFNSESSAAEDLDCQKLTNRQMRSFFLTSIKFYNEDFN